VDSAVSARPIRITRSSSPSRSIASVVNSCGNTPSAPEGALSQGSAPSIAAGQLGGQRGYTKLVDGYRSARHRDHPESGCGVAGIAADVARADGSARASYTRQVPICLGVLADLIDNPDRQAGEREAVLTLSALVGAISIARAVDDPDLPQQIVTNAATAFERAHPEMRLSSARSSGLKFGPEPRSLPLAGLWSLGGQNGVTTSSQRIIACPLIGLANQSASSSCTARHFCRRQQTTIDGGHR
jgi:hypothetical protein